MAQAAINEVSLDKETLDKEMAVAAKGMLHIERKILYPGYRIFRFASNGYRVDWLTNGWWIGFSPFGAVDQLAHGDQGSLSRVARAALAVAIDPNRPHFNHMDVLLSARITATLAAWTGRPRIRRRWRPRNRTPWQTGG